MHNIKMNNDVPRIFILLLQNIVRNFISPYWCGEKALEEQIYPQEKEDHICYPILDKVDDTLKNLIIKEQVGPLYDIKTVL